MKNFLQYVSNKKHTIFSMLIVFFVLRVYLVIAISNNSLYEEVSIFWKFSGLLFDTSYAFFIGTISCLLTFFISKLSNLFAEILLHFLIFAFIFIEIGLQQYYLTMFQALDESVFYFSWKELTLIVGLGDRLTFSAISGILVLFALYILLSLWMKKRFPVSKKMSKSYLYVVLIAFLMFPISYYSSDTELVRVGLVNNKSAYFIHRSVRYFWNKDENHRLITLESFSELDKDFYQRSKVNPLYPIYQELPDSSNLSPFFNQSTEKPNVVFIIVESLSSDLVGVNANQTGNLMPFLDSLANHSLYFPNVLSTAERTHNVLPATLASLPNTVDGTIFQQIEYPNHWSMISLLHRDYFSRFYCGVRMEFINMQGFMRYQKTNYLSEKWSKENRTDSAKVNASWGFPDECVFQQSIQDLSILKSKKPYFDVFLTISTHDPFKYPQQKKWMHFAKRKINRIKDKSLKKTFLNNIEAMGSYSYSDDAIRNFINRLKENPKFKNTIFIITGDHGTERCQIDALSPYKVPLIIYSPLLNRSQQFNAISTHLDIPVSILNLLHKKYKIDVPITLPFIGKELDTRAQYHFDRSLVFSSTQWRSDNVFSKGFALIDNVLYDLKSSIHPKKIKSEKKFKELKKQMNLYQLFSRYVIQQNKIVPVEIHDQQLGTISWELLNEWETKFDLKKDLEKYNLIGKSKINNQSKNLRIKVETEMILHSLSELDSIVELGITADFHEKMKPSLFLFKNIKPLILGNFKKDQKNKLIYTIEFSPKTFEKLKNKNQMTFYFYNRLGKKQQLEKCKIQIYTGK